MEEVEQPVLMLVDTDAQFIYVSPKVVDLGTARQIPQILQILERSSDFSAMRFCLGPDVIQGRFVTCLGAIEFEAERHWS